MSNTVTPAFTAPATSLVRLLETAAVFAGNDDTLPMLTAVRLERHKGDLIAVSTDRFRMGVVRIPVEWDDAAPENWATLIPGDDVAQIVTSYKKTKDGQALVSARPDPAQSHRTDADQLVIEVRGSSISLKITPLDAEFPKWRKLIEIAMTSVREVEENTAPPLLTFDFLKTFEKAKWSRNDNLTIQHGAASKPVLMRCGSHFVGIQMPVRLPDADAFADIITEGNDRAGNRHGVPERQPLADASSAA